ncbi:MAG: agmatine deiminase [Acidimicrobiia bacterium]|nr:agmatine deiminase [Acidimicrobiia bacterium]
MSELRRGTPAADGFRMPGEFEPHAGCWMAWPARPDNWRDGARPAREAFAAVANAIAESESVTVAVNAGDGPGARAMLDPSVRILEIPSDDAWMRDIGPTFVVDDAGARRGVDWEFNAWGGADGGLYPSWDHDDAMASAVCGAEAVDRYRAPFVLEGGSIHSDGEGTLLVTEECLLNPNRNPTRSRSELDRLLREFTGAERVVWLGLGVVNDETDGHVDNLCCFVRPGVVLLSSTDDRADPQYERSLDARRRLESDVDAQGRSFEVHLVHQPGPLTVTAEEAAAVVRGVGVQARRAGDRLAASYVNFYPANDRVVVPGLDGAHDDEALAVIGELFPDRRVVSVPAREVLLGGGNIHCITQPVPGGPR